MKYAGWPGTLVIALDLKKTNNIVHDVTTCDAYVDCLDDVPPNTNQNKFFPIKNSNLPMACSHAG